MTGVDRRLFLAASGAVLAGCAPTETGPGLVGADAAATPAWRSRARLPWPAQEIYAAVWNGRVAVAGGLVGRPDGLHIEDRVGLYTPGTDAWEEGPRLPAPRHHPMVVADDDGGLFVIGGYGRSEAGDWTSMTEVWTLDDDRWRETGRLPAPQAETVGLAHDGMIHLIGGRAPTIAANGEWNDQGDIDTHRVFDPASGAWSERAPLPMARNSAAGVAHDRALWVTGGRTVQGGGTGRLDRYDPARDAWDTLAPIPPSPIGQQVGGGLAMGVLGDGRLAAFGGEWFAPGGGGVFAETWIYDTGRDAWEAGPDMPTPRHGLAAATVEGVVYAVAGGEVVSGGRAGSVVEALAL